MRLLLDAHALIWWLAGRFFSLAKSAGCDRRRKHEIFVSAALGWEIATKHRIGKLDQAAVLAADVARVVAQQGFLELPITLRPGQIAGALAGPHPDPFERMLVAQAMAQDLQLTSQEAVFAAYSVRVLGDEPHSPAAASSTLHRTGTRRVASRRLGR